MVSCRCFLGIIPHLDYVAICSRHTRLQAGRALGLRLAVSIRTFHHALGADAFAAHEHLAVLAHLLALGSVKLEARWAAVIADGRAAHQVVAIGAAVECRLGAS